ncbi:uncharacterized protein LOC141816415 isoform X1 [Curcuma longa]|uniref:uncharacterized protein LOC141816415 isoform X1 n=1 Tax=Curcuma longa TaxID=136217 RepID=UPI003D9F517B
MEKVGDSQSSSEPVVPTSNEMMKRQKRVLKVEAESSEICLEKIKGVLEKLRERGGIDTWSEERDGMVMVLGYFDPEKLRMELENEAGDAIKSITDTTNSIHIVRDGTLVIELENLQDVMGQPQGLPEMPVTQVADSSQEILDHTEEEPMVFRCCLWFPFRDA